MRFISLFIIMLFLMPSYSYAHGKDGIYESVIKSGKIRCGYFTWSPFLMKDPNSGKFSGIYYDLIEKIGEQLSLEIEWSEDTGQANPFEGMKTGRFDMFCGPITPTPDRSKKVLFSNPFTFIPYFAYARIDDNRYAGSLDLINNNNIKIAVIDGEFAGVIAKKKFPEASMLSLPAMSDGAQVMMSVTSGKADVFLNDSAATAVFIKNNPDSVRAISNEPLKTIAAVIVLPQHDVAFKNMIDSTMALLIEDGTVEEIISNYEEQENMFLRVSKPYQIGK